MNNIHQVIFNKSTQQFVVVSELAKSARKPKTVSAGLVDIVSILQNFLKKDRLAQQTAKPTEATIKAAVGVSVCL